MKNAPYISKGENMKITESIKYVGVNDHKIDFFEAQYSVPNGMSYNSYIILDERIAVLDTVDLNFTREWLDNIANALKGRTPDYLIIQHMEPDHSANINNFIKVYPNTQIVANPKAFAMMDNFFGGIDNNKKLPIENGSSISLGRHNLTFIFAPMVHWPEVMFTYESTEKILFSADAFGKFGALDIDEPWDDEARRYYFGIVGKYGVQVQNALTKIVNLHINKICPLHGYLLEKNIDYYLNKYSLWSTYTPEDDGVVIAYTSIYGNTKKAVMMLANNLKLRSFSKVITMDLARVEWSWAVATTFQCSKLVLATTTYNSDIFPYMRQFLEHLIERNFQKRTVGFIENGSWAPTANKIMRGLLENCKNINYINNSCTIRSALNKESITALKNMADELSQ